MFGGSREPGRSLAPHSLPPPVETAMQAHAFLFTDYGFKNKLLIARFEQDVRGCHLCQDKLAQRVRRVIKKCALSVF